MFSGVLVRHTERRRSQGDDIFPDMQVLFQDGHGLRAEIERVVILHFPQHSRAQVYDVAVVLLPFVEQTYEDLLAQDPGGHSSFATFTMIGKARD